MSAEEEAQALLRTVADESLLKSFASLTRKMQRLDSDLSRNTRDDEAKVRAQRDLVQAEILRRMAPTPVVHHLRYVWSAKRNGFRWSCSCGSEGLTYGTRSSAKRLWQAHTPKES